MDFRIAIRLDPNNKKSTRTRDATSMTIGSLIRTEHFQFFADGLSSVLTDSLDVIHCAVFVTFPNGYFYKTSRGETGYRKQFNVACSFEKIRQYMFQQLFVNVSSEFWIYVSVNLLFYIYTHTNIAVEIIISRVNLRICTDVLQQIINPFDFTMRAVKIICGPSGMLSH